MLDGIARSRRRPCPSVVELALRDDDAVRSIPQARGQQWPLQQRVWWKCRKGRYQDGIQQRTAERVEVPKISCGENAEVAKTALQERISERSQVIGVPKISRRDSVEIVKKYPSRAKF